MQAISGNSWFTIVDECGLRASATGSDERPLIFGEPTHPHELTFAPAASRNFVAKGTAVLVELKTAAASANIVSSAVAVE